MMGGRYKIKARTCLDIHFSERSAIRACSLAAHCKNVGCKPKIASNSFLPS